MNNINKFMQMLQAIKNPQNYVENYMKNNTNPILANLVELAKKNDIKELENFARNIFKQNGQNYDEIKKILNIK